ncbi:MULTISPECIES: ornithine cyclodeaminase family protein [Acidianus]|uniref:Ornithine cyclodeaminase n=1 Tax=Candidatus Acidianus copahuensis TaxID=1160895 RepID=A0A031LSS3_9CREN|nr:MULTISPECIES: ornithine cyclodeaminase family protein [Acidianus]EZQ10871.1 ornithine cyclodeaminase [Candidatus Acidianus copahuensis]NON62018.1 ornithine cyclodeaminase family protein [Acidianus sp. RZ1]
MALLLKEKDVASILNFKDSYRALREAFEKLGGKNAVNSKRVRTSFLGTTLTYQAGGIDNYVGFKTYIKGNFISMLFSSEGELLAIVESDRMGQIRTSALSVLASDVIKGNYSSVGIIGLGKQGLAQVECFFSIKGISPTVFTRSQERLSKSLEFLRSRGIGVNTSTSIKDLIKSSEVVVSITSAKDPFIKLDYINKPLHLNLMGSNIPERVEAYPEVIKASETIAVEDVEQALEEAGDLVLANKMNMLDVSKVIGFSSILVGKVKINKEGITIFKSTGIGLEDVAVLKVIYEKAVKMGLGKEVEVVGKWFPELGNK